MPPSFQLGLLEEEFHPVRPTGCLSECLALPTNDLISQKNSSISYVIFPAGQRNRLSLSTPSPLNPFLSPVQPGPRVLYFLIPCPLSGAMGFPGSSVGKEFSCNVGDSGSIPELGRSAGEGICYPPQYSAEVRSTNINLSSKQSPCAEI